MGLAVAGASASAYENPPFPRTGGVNNGTPYNYDDPAYQAALAKHDVVIIKTYPGRASWNNAIQSIKKINPHALVFMYVLSSELGEPSALGLGGTAWDTYRSKIDTMKWWLYTAEGSGQRVKSPFPNYYVINNSDATKADSSGYNANQWIARFFVDNYYKPNAQIDGFFTDNTFWRPVVTGDWNRDGKADSMSDPLIGTAVRKGYANYYATVRKLMPGKLQIGNIGSLGEATAVFPEYKDMLDGGLIEGLIGKSWSVEGYAGWDAMMARYRKVTANVVGPKIVIVNQWGDPKDYRAARYGITSTLMDDGYHSFTDTAKGYTGVVWFDEYNAKLGMPIVAEPPTKAWNAGVWRRDFQGGIALVNPKGNGAKTLTLEEDFIALKGTQDPTVNNGQTVRKITLQDRDGIILMRRTPITRIPKAPIIVAR